MTEYAPGYQTLGLHETSFTTFIRMPRTGVYCNLPDEVKQDIQTTLSGVIAASVFEILTRHNIGETKDELEQDG